MWDEEAEGWSPMLGTICDLAPHRLKSVPKGAKVRIGFHPPERAYHAETDDKQPRRRKAGAGRGRKGAKGPPRAKKRKG